MTDNKKLTLLILLCSFVFYSNTLFAKNQAKKSTISRVDYKQVMRNFVISLSEYAKTRQNNFLIIPQNGQELITNTGEATGKIQLDYLNAIDATGRENLFYGYNEDNELTPKEDTEHLLALSLLSERYNVTVMTTDYCSTPSKMAHSYQINQKNGFISFAANQRTLNNIPNYPIYNENTDDIIDISNAKNFLYLINSERYSTKEAFINAVSATNYDVIIMDLFHHEIAYNAKEINQLKIKNNGGKRLIIAYMSIGEAEDYRYYWQKKWKKNSPNWLEPENPEWKGNYKVRYWDKDWQAVIFGNDNAYLDKIIKSNFDGVYLDIVDAFEYFEELKQ